MLPSLIEARRPTAALALLLAVACQPHADDTGSMDPTELCWADQALPFDTMPRPEHAVQVLIDPQAVPHIYASTDRDLFWGAGYMQARDRLFQLDTSRRTAMGTLAEVVGEDALDSDRQARTMAFDRFGCLSVVQMQQERPDDYGLFVAWVSGVNARIDEVRSGAVELPWGFGPDELDYLPEPIGLEEVLAQGKRIQFGFGNSITNDILYSVIEDWLDDPASFPVFEPGAQRFIMVDSLDAPSVTPPRSVAISREAAGFSADERRTQATAVLDAALSLQRNHGAQPMSNNWAIHADHTIDGRPLLANDPHAHFAEPNLIYAQHLDSAAAGGAFSVAGFGFVGVPGVHLGHNQAVAWAATTNMADIQDIWDVDFDGETVDLGGERVPVRLEEEIILVRQDDGSQDDETLDVYWVDDVGVIMPDEVLPIASTMFADGAVMFGWTGFQPTTEFFGFLDFDRAADLDAFEVAVDLELVGMHNWVFASAQGIRYHTHGLVPDRGPQTQRSTPYRVMDASDPDTLWTDAMLDDTWMAKLDGSQDFIVTANNDPWGVTADGDPTNDEVYYASWFASGYRAERIHRVLSELTARGDITSEEMATLQMDEHSLMAEALVPALVELVERVPTDEALVDWRTRDDVLSAAAELGSWDYAMSMDSRQAALFRVWVGFLGDAVLDDDLDFLLGAIEDAAPVLLAKALTLAYAHQREGMLDGMGDEAMLQSLADALDAMAERAVELGVDELSWGDLHLATFEPAWGDDVQLPMGGWGDTVNVADCSIMDRGGLDPSCDTVHGAIFRQVTRFEADGTPQMIYNRPQGSDGDSTRWQQGQFVELPFEASMVEAAAVETLVLDP